MINLILDQLNVFLLGILILRRDTDVIHYSLSLFH